MNMPAEQSIGSGDNDLHGISLKGWRAEWWAESAIERFADFRQGQQQFLQLLLVELVGVVGVVVVDRRLLHVSLGEVLAIVEVAVIEADAVVVAHVLGAAQLLPAGQGLVELLAMAHAD